jgi:hypothetical protein
VPHGRQHGEKFADPELYCEQVLRCMVGGVLDSY